MINAKSSLIAGTIAALSASARCVGPLLFVGFGFSGAWIGNLIALEPYRPVFIALALIFFGIAFRKLYFVPRVCLPGSACAASLTYSWQRAVFWIVAAPMTVLLAVPVLAPLFM